MIAAEKLIEIQRTAEQLYDLGPDWVTFYRETLGLGGIVRHAFPTRDEFEAFQQTEAYREILAMLTKLRQEGPLQTEENEPTRVITVRLPKSMHESLRTEAYERHTSMNKLCISKLLQFIDEDKVPTESWQEKIGEKMPANA